MLFSRGLLSCSDIADGFSPENQALSPLEQQLKAKKLPLLQLVGQVRSLVEKITSPAADTSRASASLCAALEDLKAVSGPGLNPLSGRPLAPVIVKPKIALVIISICQC